jgi:CheY-like chemotaxis protein
LKPEQEAILVMDRDSSSREALEQLLRGAGYEVSTSEICHEGLQLARNRRFDLVLLDSALPGAICGDTLAELKGASATENIRVIVLEKGGEQQRAQDLDLGADDVASRPWDPIEMMARVRNQLRAKRAWDEFRKRTVIAEQGQEMSRTAFQALAVTEKMERDAYSIGRGMKIGVAALLVIAGVMGVIYFRFSRRANFEARRTSAVIARLNLGLMRQGDLVAHVREAGGAVGHATSEAAQAAKEQPKLLHGHVGARNGKAGRSSNSRFTESGTGSLRQAHSELSAAQQIIHSYADSVCLIHAVVAFRDKSTGKRLRYVGISPDGRPIMDHQGNPEVSLEGSGPDVLVHAFGTGFLVSTDGQVLTNHHVAEPWWNNDELNSMTSQGLEPVMDRLEAYFPGSPLTFPLSIVKISPDADLALIHAELRNLKRPPLIIDGSKKASVSGESVVLMGYPTGIDAILARADDATIREIAAASQGDLNEVLSELAKRRLIYPVITQGHLGDVLPDKIIYDAQTTSGGSGGPLFDPQGRVIGINYAIIQGFGGSNFGIPSRFATALFSP